eukprot:425937_1
MEGTRVTATDGNPYQTIEMQPKESMIELQRVTTRHMHGRNHHDIDDDDKQETPDLNTIWATLELLKRNQEEAMKNQQEANQAMKNQEKMLSSIQEVLQKK